MTPNDRVLDFIRRWEDLQRQGKPISLEELCSDSPELLDEVRKGLQHGQASQEQPGKMPTTAHTPDPSTTEPSTVGIAGQSASRPNSALVESSQRYRVLRFHKKGGQGEVHVALDTELNREVALKKIQGHLQNDASIRHRFLREAEITARLEHPGVVPVHGLIEDADGRPSYAMRFIQGRSLREAIEEFHEADKSGRDPGERSLAFRQLLQRFVAVCNTVAYAHSRGIIHRDLKPANVMLGKYGETMVVDWGLGKFVGRDRTPARSASEGDVRDQSTLAPTLGSDADSTRQGEIVGTPAFMSPEQASGNWEVVGPLSDIYSLGAVLYVLLTGKTPFPEPNAGRLLFKVQQGEFLRPRQIKAEVPTVLEAICLKAMARRPDDRYASVLDLAADIEHWLADEPVVAHREPWRQRAGRWVRRHRTLATAAVVLLAASVVGLSGGLWAVDRERIRTAQERDAKDNALQAEKDALERAEESYRLAREAMDGAMKLQDDLRFKQGPLEDVRRLLLQAEASFYQKFSQLRGDRERFRRDRAEALSQLGRITQALGSKVEAVEHYRQALYLWQQLAGDHPSLHAYRNALAKDFNHLGLLYNEIGRQHEAENVFGQALAIRRELVQTQPGVREYQSGLALCHSYLGLLYFDTGRVPAAEESLNQALAIQKDLAQARPDESDYQSGLAATYNHLGILHETSKRLTDAESVFGQALAIRAKLVRDYPNATKHQSALAKVHHNQAHLLQAMNRLPEAESAFRQALAIQQELVRIHPAVLEYRDDLGKHLSDLGNFCRRMRRLKEAEEFHEQALTVKKELVRDYPVIAEYQNGLAGTLVNVAILRRSAKDWKSARRLLEEAVPYHQAALKAKPRHPTFLQFFRNNRMILAEGSRDVGDHEAAARAVAEALAINSQPATDNYAGARVLARCVFLAAHDEKLPSARRKELSEAYASQAMAALTRAVKAGYRNILQLKLHKDLDPLRNRDDFKKLLAELENQAPVATPVKK